MGRWCPEGPHGPETREAAGQTPSCGEHVLNCHNRVSKKSSDVPACPPTYRISLPMMSCAEACQGRQEGAYTRTPKMGQNFPSESSIPPPSDTSYCYGGPMTI